MSKTNGGGPVHSVDVPGTSHYGLVCLNLRDHFAGQALQGICASMTGDEAKRMETEAAKRKTTSGALITQVAYQLADAMRAARGGAQ